MLVDLKDVVGLRFSLKGSDAPARELYVPELVKPGWISPVLKVLDKDDNNAMQQFGPNEKERLCAFVNGLMGVSFPAQAGTLKVPLVVEIIVRD